MVRNTQGRKEGKESAEADVREDRNEGRRRKATVAAGVENQGGFMRSEWKQQLVSARCSQRVQYD